MKLFFGLLKITLAYTYIRGSTIYYQRPVPKALQARYPSKTIRHDLKTNDMTVAEKAVVLLNRRYEAEWAGLLAAPESSPAALKAHADALLKTHGLTPGGADNHPMAVELLHDHLDAKRQRYASGDEDTYRIAAPTDYLSPVEIKAGQRLHGTAPYTLSDALEFHLRIHPKAADTKFATYQRRVFAGLIAVTGDKAIADFSREDARTWLESSLARGNKTTTVRRIIGALHSVFATDIRENNLQRTNPFAGLKIPSEGGDSEQRQPFTPTELSTLYAACHTKDDDRRWLLALLIDTGARLAEITGLALSDIRLDADIPHVLIQVQPWRSLKNAGSRREIPLVGAALWAAHRIKTAAVTGQLHAFHRYTSNTECKTTNASATLAGWIRRIPLDHTAHDLRHTMPDRLREVQCPREIQLSIAGHASQDVGDGYGKGYSLKVKLEWLLKVGLPTPA
jgi:integrase